MSWPHLTTCPSFHGTAPEPRPHLSSGHIANSFSLPFTALLSRPSDTDPPYQTLLEPAELEKVFSAALGPDTWEAVKAGKQVVWQTCGSGQTLEAVIRVPVLTWFAGMTAAIIWLGLRRLGLSAGSRLFDGSWTEFASRPDSEIVKS